MTEADPSPPYEVDAKPDPLNQYGRQKLQGEQATLETKDKGAKVIVLRVPVLYGDAETNSESAVNVLVDGECPAAAPQCTLAELTLQSSRTRAVRSTPWTTIRSVTPQT